jgi:hypothetical protein
VADGITVAAALLVVGPVVGGISAANPILFPVWTASREDHLAIVGAHREALVLVEIDADLRDVDAPQDLAALS